MAVHTQPPVRLSCFSTLSEVRTRVKWAAADAQARQRELEGVLRQWNCVGDLDRAEGQLTAERDRAAGEITRREAAIEDRRRGILGELKTPSSTGRCAASAFPASRPPASTRR